MIAIRLGSRNGSAGLTRFGIWATSVRRKLWSSFYNWDHRCGW